MGWSGIPWMLVIPQSATLPIVGRRGHTRLTVLQLSDNQLYSGRTVWHGQPNQYCTKHSVSPTLHTYHSILTRLLNSGHQVAHSPTHHRSTSHRSIGVAHWARKPRWCLGAGVPVKRAAVQ